MVDTLRPDSTMQGVPYMRTDPEGAFVSKDDYDALQAKHDNLAWNLDGCMESINNLSAQKDTLAAELAEANAGRDKLITRDVESAMRIRALEAALAECAQVRDNWCNEYTKARDELVVARKFFDRIPAHAGIAKSNYMTTLEDLDQLRRKAYKAEAALREIAAMPNEDNEWDAVDKYATARAIAIASPAETFAEPSSTAPGSGKTGL